MSGSNQLAAYLPFVLGALLVGGALAGGFMERSRRTIVERHLLFPLYAIAAAGLFALKVWQHDWLLAAIWFLVVTFVCGTLYRRLRTASSEGLS